MIGLMDKGGANSIDPQQGALTSAFMNSAPMQNIQVPQITAPSMWNLPQMPAMGAFQSHQSPQDAASATAARLLARTPPPPAALTTTPAKPTPVGPTRIREGGPR